MDQGAPSGAARVDEGAPVTTLKGIGPKVAERLTALGIETIRDLAEHVPRSFLDWSQATGFGKLRLGQEATVECTVERARVRPTRRRNLRLVEASVTDREGGRATALWFNQAWLAERLVRGTQLLVHGQLQGGGAFRVERHEIAGEGAGLHTVGLVPVYPATETVSAAKLRELTERVLPLARWFTDPLPAELRQEEGLPLRADALAAYHRPRRLGDVDRARERLALDELLGLKLGLLERRRALEAEAVAPALGEDGEVVARYRDVLPFTLTVDQEAAIAAIREDLRGTRPMQRLLQGDVGSGKTVVALYALLRAVERGMSGALMAPTETLAEQHFLTIEPICAALGVHVALLTASVKGEVADTGVVVGTHALIQEGVELPNLALAVVDEQHRFGVEQRRALGARTPHMLHMTATPIPRTLAQTVYGDLDVTEIARPPQGRKPVTTRWVAHERSAEAYIRLRKHLEKGRQA